MHKYTVYFQMIPEIGNSLQEIKFQSSYSDDYCASNIIEKKNITMQYFYD